MITGRLYIPVNQPLPPGKKMFQANVKGKNSAGYTIETVIDGKPLHGVKNCKEKEKTYLLEVLGTGIRVFGWFLNRTP